VPVAGLVLYVQSAGARMAYVQHLDFGFSISNGSCLQ